MLGSTVIIVLPDGSEHAALVIEEGRDLERVAIAEEGRQVGEPMPPGPAANRWLNLVYVSPDPTQLSTFGRAIVVAQHTPHADHAIQGKPCWKELFA